MEFFMPRKNRRAPKSATFYSYRRGHRLFSCDGIYLHHSTEPANR
jgi:hypothetical protein